MATEFGLLPSETSVEATSPQHRFEEAVDTFLSSTREIFLNQLSQLQPDQVPVYTVEVKRGEKLEREAHPLIKIPGRVRPGESVFLTEFGDLYAVMQSVRPGLLDGEQARPLLPEEMIAFAPLAIRQIDKIKNTPRKP